MIVDKTAKSSLFTLIELLVVIAIIAILASLLLPVLSRARFQARIAVCIGQHKQYALGVTMYTSDYDDFYPDGIFNDTNLSWGRPMSWRIDTGGSSRPSHYMNVFGTYFSNGDWSTSDSNRYRNLSYLNPLFQCPQGVAEVPWSTEAFDIDRGFVGWRFATLPGVTGTDNNTKFYSKPENCLQKVGQTWRLDAQNNVYDGLKYDILTMDAISGLRSVPWAVSGCHMWGGAREYKPVDGNDYLSAPLLVAGVDASHTNIFSHTDGHVSTDRANTNDIYGKTTYARGNYNGQVSDYFPLSYAVDD